ncbi:MAG: winged helix-turn-helix transcriptional regulator [Sphingomonadaceae bacterium]
MELEKITTVRDKQKRQYDDACGAALGLYLLGDRWAMLIVRELMYGPKRFGEIRASLPGISANVLTQRLDELEASRILERRKLPPPASAQVYELTEWGYEAEPIIQHLGKWATRSPLHDPMRPLSVASMIMSLKTMIDRRRAEKLVARVGFRFGDESFNGRLTYGSFQAWRGEIDNADTTFIAEPRVLAAAIYGGRPLAELEADGLLRVEGDRALADRFVTLFPLPQKFL